MPFKTGYPVSLKKGLTRRRFSKILECWDTYFRSKRQELDRLNHFEQRDLAWLIKHKGEIEELLRLVQGPMGTGISDLRWLVGHRRELEGVRDDFVRNGSESYQKYDRIPFTGLTKFSHLLSGVKTFDGVTYRTFEAVFESKNEMRIDFDQACFNTDGEISDDQYCNSVIEKFAKDYSQVVNLCLQQFERGVPYVYWYAKSWGSYVGTRPRR